MGIKVREKELKDGRKSLYLDIYHNGKRRYEFLKDLPKLTGNRAKDKEIRQLAESIKAKRQLEIANNAHGFVPAFKQKADFVDYFQKVVESHETATEAQYRNVLLKVKEYAGDNVQFGAIDEKWVEGFKEYLLGSIAKSTARVYITMLKAVLNKAVKERVINRNPADNVDNFKKQKGHVPYLEKAELKKLQETELDRWDLKDAFFFSCYTGLRYSDVKKLKWDQIRNDRIQFRQKKTEGVEYVPLNNQAKEILQRMPKDRPNVFKIASSSGVNMALKDWAKDAGLKRWVKIIDKDSGDTIQKGLHYHVSRHTFAVQLLSNGVDVFTLKELMGHDSIDSTMVYADIVNKTKEDAINKFPEL
ncbi:MAG: site-specific integrase [Balneolaceae bacterium]|nr:site-specific integrase [Balneolaceae bacterium]